MEEEKSFYFKKDVPAKNIHKVLVDVKEPGREYAYTAEPARLHLEKFPHAPLKRKRKKIIFAASFATLLILAVGIFAIYRVGEVKSALLEKGNKIVQNFSTSAESLKGLKPGDATIALRENAEELASLNNVIEKNYGGAILDVVGKVVPAAKGAASILSNVTSLNVNFLGLADSLDILQKNGFQYFQSNGKALLGALQDVKARVAGILEKAEMLRNESKQLEGVSSFFRALSDSLDNRYLKYTAELYGWNKALDSLLNIFASETEKHILIFFQNPGEIRPGGGFIGSYADIGLKGGQMIRMDVRDVYDPDGQLATKTIPPKPLLGITQTWGARDANWFFDFPTSAKNVVSFLEASKIYSEQNVTFEGAIAININVLGTLLDIVGPVDLPDYKITLTKDNFLAYIQREVEAGEDHSAGHPKKILSVLAPILLDRLHALPEEKQQQMVTALRDHLAAKDIMLFAKDENLANLFSSTDVDGGVYQEPANSFGSYFAVVNASVGGGKSDVFIDQSVQARIDIDTDGGMFTDVEISRKHSGNTQKDPWWRATNKDFIKIFANEGSSLVSLDGNDAKLGLGKLDTNAGYSINPDLETIENTQTYVSAYNVWSFNEFGKTSFGAWLITQAGQMSVLHARYQTPPNQAVVLAPGKVFRFVFDKQSGVAGHLDVSISPPIGYGWEESSGPTYGYHSDNLPGRIILNLTLKKL